MHDAFLWWSTRRVDRTGRIRLDGNVYETQLGLEGRQVEARFHPLDLRRVQVLCEGRRYDDAIAVKLLHRVSADVNPRHHERSTATSEPTSNYLSHLLEKHEHYQRGLLSPLRFAQADPKGGDKNV